MVTCRDISMTVSVNIRSNMGHLSTNLSSNQDGESKFTPRGEVEMTPKSKGEKQNESHNNLEEKQKNRIFEAYFRERVL